MATKYRVVKVKGVNPERFMVIGIDFDKHAIISTSESMVEAEMREFMKKAGASELDIKTWLEQARKYPS